MQCGRFCPCLKKQNIKGVEQMRKIIIISLFFLTLKALMASAPPWVKTYGGIDHDWAECIQQTSDGGYIVAGTTWSFGTGWDDIWILKLDSAGNIEWQRTYGGKGRDEGECIQQTSEGGYIVAGTTESFGEGCSDIWILKLNSEGFIEWQRTYGGNGLKYDHAECIQQTNDGGYIVAGDTGTLSNIWGYYDVYYDIWILKLNSEGFIEWQRTYGGNHSDGPRSIQQTSDGGYIVAGETWSFGAGCYDFWILKLDPAGNIQWQRTYGGNWCEETPSIQQTSDKGYIVTGSTNHPCGWWCRDILILKLNPVGDIEWQRTYGTYEERDIAPDMEGASSIQETSDGGYIIAGFTDYFGAGNYDFLVLKLNPYGDIDLSCDEKGFILKNSNWVISDTFVLPYNTNIIPKNTNVIPLSTHISPQDTNTISTLVCSGKKKGRKRR
jgi:hypothetical protein